MLNRTLARLSHSILIKIKRRKPDVNQWNFASFEANE